MSKTNSEIAAVIEESRQAIWTAIWKLNFLKSDLTAENNPGYLFPISNLEHEITNLHMVSDQSLKTLQSAFESKA